ncbi:hypothetical protein PCC9214_03601 [Planktothrix tepida]|uniref:Uncharacterized protein n=2 Tax=Planktothrix TaxID=54304 RepID=A0A1J1LUB9_9CYAN|nr:MULTISPECIES: hypothetical protein [Planktothrix]CAD5943250.1 hypothetical protein NO713_02060 [Planktothrix pseudagardhii]CAD5967669.1 hypothetical protein PCC9214_03601 [Planktothrix tepida]CUR35145.1 conserved exported hypothetical protein [Planktothrix tepida PCC 9214]
MKFLTSLLIALVLMLNLVFSQPASAEPKYTKNPDYIEVTQALKQLSLVAEDEKQTQGAISKPVQQQLDYLQFQQYALKSATHWGQCTNKTGKTIAVYGSPQKEDQEDQATLYFLGDNQTTPKKWDCDGFYLPQDIKGTNLALSEQSEPLQGPIAVKILDGTQLEITTNPDTGTLEFNSPLAKVVQANDTHWFIPNISQSIIDSQIPNTLSTKKS